jgi:hypothetical protein
MHAPDETAILQIREVAPDRLADHSETVCERGDRDPFFLPDQGKDFLLALVAEQGGPRGVALPAGAAGPRVVVRGFISGQEVLPVSGRT